MSTKTKLSSNTDFIVRPIGGRIGGEVEGITLSADLSDTTLAALETALLRHKVLFFRGQTHLDDQSQEAFAKRLGEPAPHPTVPVRPGSSYLLELNSERGGRANSWHTDVTFVPDYPKASILRAVTSPTSGGDTVWANTAEAYSRLPDTLKSLADTLWALHTNDYDYAANRSTPTSVESEAYRAIFASTVYETEHPLVRIHPVTGERSLVLGHFVKRFVGLSTHDSQRLFDIFQNQIIALENTVRWRWQEGDVAIWDNRSTQHYAVNDYGDQHRVMRRVTLKGEVPVAIDGQTSRAVKPVSSPVAVAAE